MLFFFSMYSLGLVYIVLIMSRSGLGPSWLTLTCTICRETASKQTGRWNKNVSKNCRKSCTEWWNDHLPPPPPATTTASSQYDEMMSGWESSDCGIIASLTLLLAAAASSAQFCPPQVIQPRSFFLFFFFIITTGLERLCLCVKVGLKSGGTTSLSAGNTLQGTDQYQLPKDFSRKKRYELFSLLFFHAL